MKPAAPDTSELLRTVPLFADVDADALGMLASRCRRRKTRARDALFHEGDPGYALYVILTGRVNIEKTTESGEVVHLAQRGAGEHVGEMALVDGMPRSADAYTDAACELLVLDRPDFLYCLERSPRLALSVIACLARRLREADDRQAEHQSRDVMGRLSSFLLGEMANGEADERGGCRLLSRITQQEIAERIATSRETVNRGLSRLRQVGAIRLDGRKIVIMSSDKLKRYAHG